MQPTSEFSLIQVFQTLFRYRWYLISLSVAAVVIAFVLTMPFFYPPEFRSSTVIYPTNSQRFDVLNIFREVGEVYLYGDAKELERLSNIVASEELRLAVIDSLNMWAAYGIDPGKDEGPKAKALKALFTNLKATQIEGTGLEITAYDVDPARAAALVNVTVAKVDEINKRMVNQNKLVVLKLFEEGYQSRKASLEMYTDSIRKIRRQYNVFNNVTQTEVMVQEVMRAESRFAATRAVLRDAIARSGADSPEARQAKLESDVARERLQAMLSGSNSISLQKFQEGVDKVMTLEDICEMVASELQVAERKMEFLRVATAEDFTTLLVSGPAMPSDKKARPVRWIILAAALMGALIAGALTVIAIDHFRSQQAA